MRYEARRAVEKGQAENQGGGVGGGKKKQRRIQHAQFKLKRELRESHSKLG